jgi:hypothetical protein
VKRMMKANGGGCDGCETPVRTQESGPSRVTCAVSMGIVREGLENKSMDFGGAIGRPRSHSLLGCAP